MTPPSPNPSPTPSAKSAKDAQLVRSALGGDRSAAEALEARLLCVPRFLTLINRRHGGALGSHDLEDLAQDALIRIWKKLGTFEGRATLETWMFRFSLLEYLNRLRGTWKNTSPLATEPPGREGDVATRIGEHDELLRSLTEIPEPESSVIELRHFDGLSFKDIADRIGVPLNTTRTRYYRGLKRLRSKLSNIRAEEAS